MWDQMVQWLKWLKRLQTLMLVELQEICVFKSSRDTLYCPADGWAPDERVQLEEKLDVCVEAEISNDFKPFQSQACTILYASSVQRLSDLVWVRKLYRIDGGPCYSKQLPQSCDRPIYKRRRNALKKIEETWKLLEMFLRSG